MRASLPKVPGADTPDFASSLHPPCPGGLAPVGGGLRCELPASGMRHVPAAEVATLRTVTSSQARKHHRVGSRATCRNSTIASAQAPCHGVWRQTAPLEQSAPTLACAHWTPF